MALELFFSLCDRLIVDSYLVAIDPFYFAGLVSGFLFKKEDQFIRPEENDPVQIRFGQFLSG
ncbi:MAG: hypothetical protein ACYC0V_21800 [Armatimonadota bacterium]